MQGPGCLTPLGHDLCNYKYQRAMPEFALSDGTRAIR